MPRQQTEPSSSPTRRSRRGRLAILAAMASLVAATACDAGRVPAATSTSEDGVPQVVGTDDLRFEPAALEVPAGTELELRCEPAVNHNLVIVETGQEVAVCPPGGSDRGVLDLEAGTYAYVCTVPGHSATMRGELTVIE